MAGPRRCWTADDLSCGLVLVVVAIGVGLVILGAVLDRAGLAVGGGVSITAALVAWWACYTWRTTHLPRAACALGHLVAGQAQLDRLVGLGRCSIPVLLKGLHVPQVWYGGDGNASRGPSHTTARVEGWDGRLVRRRAIEGLRRLKAVEAVEPLLALLQQDDRHNREAVISALGAIGDRSAVPGLVPLLGNNRLDQTAASAALRALGQGDLVGRFSATLAGDAGALRTDLTDHRGVLVEALARSLQSDWPDSAVQAARALGELGLTEALPRLRVAARSAPAPGGPFSAACREAIARLERLAALPRPAPQPELGLEQLPRMVGDGPDAATVEQPRYRRDR